MNRSPAAQRRTIVIAGGGPVGLSIATLLSSSSHTEDLDIRLFEPRQVPSWEVDTVDLRVYALSRASQSVLENLGVWKTVAAARAAPYRRMQVWQGEHDARIGSLVFDSSEIGEPDLGHIVEDSLLRAQLAGALAHTNVKLTFGVGLTAIDVGERGVDITTSDGETLSATVLVAADGSASMVRNLLKMPISTVSYAQRALVTHVTTEQPHAETAWQRFLPGGPLAFLPLNDGRSSVVWSAQAEHAEALCELDDVKFQTELQIASGGVLGQLGTTVERVSFSLNAAHARRYCDSRVALVGDAAHTVHPLAGQGMNLGFLDAAVLSDVLIDALNRGEDPGDLRVLRRYERQRKGDNLKMVLALDALHRLFQISGSLIPPLRAVGLSVINVMPLAKAVLMRQALGLRDDLPTAAKLRIA